MWVVGRVLAALSGAACVAATLVVATAPTAAAAPTDVEVSPALAPPGTTVTISGASCTGPVDLRLVSLVNRRLTTVDTATATPAPDGTWSTTVSMPADAAHVTATCDGSSAIPVVLGPENPGVHQRYATMRGTDRVEVEQTGLVEGSLFRVVTRAGTELASSVVTDGIGRVVLPWTPQLTEVLALELAPFGAGMLPFVQQFDIPLNEQVTMTPPVARRGQPVTLSGNRCISGRVGISMSGEASGWFDVATTYPGRDLAVGVTGKWSHTFSAPPEVAQVSAGCIVPDGRYYGHQFVLGSLGGPTHRGTVTLTSSGAYLSGDQLFGPLAAYRLDGTPVRLTRVGGRTFVQGRPGKLLVTEFVSFGENANADTIDSPRQWSFNIPGPVSPPPGDPTPSGAPTAPGADSPRAGADPASGLAEIPATGSASTGQLVLGVGLLLLGLAFQAAARGRTRLFPARPVSVRAQADAHTPSSFPAGSRKMNRRPPGNS